MQVWFRPARMHGHPERTPIKATITKDRGNGIVDLTYDDGEFSGNARAVPNALRLPRNVREQVAVWWDVGFEMDFQTAVDNSLKKKKDDPPPQPSPTPQAPFQQRVQPWLLECFGAAIAADRVERNHRFLEESLELVQALGCTASEAHQLVDYVFGRPVGDPPQEVGGVMVTLAALCLASDLDMHDAGEVELARISAPELVAKIRAKQAAKPKHSPLPQAATPQPAPATQQAGDDLAELSLLNRLIELGGKAAGAHATSNSDDGPKGTAAYVQWQELRSEMGELIRRFYTAAPQPSPTAQADSVLEDAARLLRQILAASQDGDSDTHLSAHFVSRIETITKAGGAA